MCVYVCVCVCVCVAPLRGGRTYPRPMRRDGRCGSTLPGPGIADRSARLLPAAPPGGVCVYATVLVGVCV